jgi:hypothetical protein
VLASVGAAHVYRFRGTEVSDTPIFEADLLNHSSYRPVVLNLVCSRTARVIGACKSGSPVANPKSGPDYLVFMTK